jgi:hypothetical protein
LQLWLPTCKGNRYEEESYIQQEANVPQKQHNIYSREDKKGIIYSTMKNQTLLTNDKYGKPKSDELHNMKRRLINGKTDKLYRDNRQVARVYGSSRRFAEGLGFGVGTRSLLRRSLGIELLTDGRIAH